MFCKVKVLCQSLDMIIFIMLLVSAPQYNLSS